MWSHTRTVKAVTPTYYFSNSWREQFGICKHGHTLVNTLPCGRMIHECVRVSIILVDYLGSQHKRKL
ncbi:hypothetical protein BJV74DRAFT_843647 [Russula compacta]|nr:hypothetical protein BJV74DRAFT_843647 [Russula compacta]